MLSILSLNLRGLISYKLIIPWIVLVSPSGGKNGLTDHVRPIFVDHLIILIK
jgi:hypothetical protein